MNKHKKIENCWIVCPKGDKKRNFLSWVLPFSKFHIWWNLEISSFEKKNLSVSHRSHFVWKSWMIKGTFYHFHSSQNDWTSMLLNGHYLQSLFSFQLIHFRNSFCYRTENNWILNVKILIRVRPLGINLTFSSPLGLLKLQDFLSFLFILKLSYSKPFHSA